MKPIYTIEEYVTEDDVSPFTVWLLGLKDKRAQAKIRARLLRASFGNFGDWKKIRGTPGLCELREHHGPGYRVLYSIEGKKLVLLLAGSDKRKETKAIADATARLADYRTRSQTDG